MKFLFRKSDKKEAVRSQKEITDALNRALDNCGKAMYDSIEIYNASRNKVEGEIKGGARITKHEINL